MKTNPAKRFRTLDYVPIVTSVSLVAASAGAPEMSCMDVNQGDISVANSERSTTNPLLLKRDNPAIGGDLYVKSLVKGQIKNPYLTDATWFSTVAGHTELSEYRAHDWLYTTQRSPILPRANVNSASDAPYGTRSGLMIHGNHYGLTLSAWDAGNDTFSQTNSDYVALDPNVLLVPVVILNWKRAALPDPYYKSYQSVASTNMLDFNPVWLGSPKGYTSVPDGCDNIFCIGTPVPVAKLPNSQELANQVESADNVPNYQYAPDFFEVPPDDIWTQCGIQFQVVAQYDVTLPAGWKNNCSLNGNNFPNPAWYTPLGTDPLLKQLDPIVLSFGDDVSDGCPFWGVTAGIGGHRVEVDHSHGMGKTATTTAHEFGHALGLPHDYVNGQPVTGNLMSTTSGNGGPGSPGFTGLTAQQCTTARSYASSFSARYDQYNYLTGRTYSSTPPPALPAGSGSGSDGGIITIGSGGGSGTGSQTCNVDADCGAGNQCLGGTCSPIPH